MLRAPSARASADKRSRIRQKGWPNAGFNSLTLCPWPLLLIQSSGFLSGRQSVAVFSNIMTVSKDSVHSEGAEEDQVPDIHEGCGAESGLYGTMHPGVHAWRAQWLPSNVDGKWLVDRAIIPKNAIGMIGSLSS